MKISNPRPEFTPKLRYLWQEAFGDTDEFLDMFFTTAFSTKRAICITENDEVLAALYWFDCTCQSRKIAYIYAVATSKKHRCKGLCRKLMESTHTHLAQNNYCAAILVPGSKGLFDMYEKLGYKTCAYVNEFTVEASRETTELVPITKDEFAALRKNHLPENAVVQEGENLDFLNAYAKFYKGGDFIFVCYKDGQKLFVPEILGSTDKACSIVNTLECKSGFFRTSGGSRPFSMCYDLSDGDFDFPKYFGLAFD